MTLKEAVEFQKEYTCNPRFYALVDLPKWEHLRRLKKEFYDWYENSDLEIKRGEEILRFYEFLQIKQTPLYKVMNEEETADQN